MLPEAIYTSLVVIHVVCSTLYVGSIIHDMLSKMWTERLRQPAALAYMYRKFVFTDAKITPWYVYILLGTGTVLTWHLALNPLTQTWLWMSIVLFALSGLFFYIRLVPVQDALEAWTVERIAVPADEYDWAGYAVMVKPWNFWVEVVTVPSVLALVLMVWRPVI